MIASRTEGLPRRRVVCSIIRVPEGDDAGADRPRRPSDLLPWADPYIFKLVKDLQQEVRRERPPVARMIRPDGPTSDLEPPSPEFDQRPTTADWDTRSTPSWPQIDRFGGIEEE